MNKAKKAIDEIKKALKELNVHGNVQITEIIPGDISRLTVHINDEYFGVYDTNKNTFVD